MQAYGLVPTEAQTAFEKFLKAIQRCGEVHLRRLFDHRSYRWQKIEKDVESCKFLVSIRCGKELIFK